MSYSTNRAAFRAVASLNPAPPLLSLYAALVLLELFLKEYLPSQNLARPSDHDVPRMLKTLATAVHSADRGVLNSLAVSLGNSLATVWCDGKSGGAQTVPQHSYPYLRYLRHSNDFPVSHSSDADLNTVLAFALQTIHTLQRISGQAI